MAAKVKGFDLRTQRYLRALPAVDMVTSVRIYYTDEFRREVMRRYEAGGSPTEIFREAGLDPKIIGYKRIERAIARWKDGGDEAKRAKKVAAESSAARKAKPLKDDPRDQLIVSQALRISELEQRVRQLEQRIPDLEEDGLSRRRP